MSLPLLLKHGGPMIWLILGASATALVVFVRRVLHYHRAQINSMEFLNGVRNVLRRENVVEAFMGHAGAKWFPSQSRGPSPSGNGSWVS